MEIYISQKEREKGREEATPPSDVSFVDNGALEKNWGELDGPLSVSFPPPLAESHFKCYYPKAFEEGGFCKAVVVCAAVWRSKVVKCSMTNRRGGSSIILGGGLTLRWHTSPDLDLKWLLYQLAGSLRRRWTELGFWGGGGGGSRSPQAHDPYRQSQLIPVFSLSSSCFLLFFPSLLFRWCLYVASSGHASFFLRGSFLSEVAPSSGLYRFDFLIATEAKAPRSKPPLRLRLQFHHRTTTLFSSPSYVLIPTGGRSQSSLCAQTVRPLKRSVLKLMSSSFLVYCSAMITLGKDKAV
ncbi:BnaC06g41970D [Brassica napus]|uniref:BnaC06g41970D protein n=1 Tax=Brassica napus TaxID=3708 RepID=A0A078IPB8_BRANA|nr:BnaC06g41970D [Brassica napus]